MNSLEEKEKKNYRINKRIKRKRFTNRIFKIKNT